jgi:hypothetical protein
VAAGARALDRVRTVVSPDTVARALAGVYEPDG